MYFPQANFLNLLILRAGVNLLEKIYALPRSSLICITYDYLHLYDSLKGQ